jgi:hypothetical protein
MSTYVSVLKGIIFFAVYEEACSEVLYSSTESVPSTEDRASYFYILCAIYSNFRGLPNRSAQRRQLCASYLLTYLLLGAESLLRS